MVLIRHLFLVAWVCCTLLAAFPDALVLRIDFFLNLNTVEPLWGLVVPLALFLIAYLIELAYAIYAFAGKRNRNYTKKFAKILLILAGMTASLVLLCLQISQPIQILGFLFSCAMIWQLKKLTLEVFDKPPSKIKPI